MGGITAEARQNQTDVHYFGKATFSMRVKEADRNQYVIVQNGTTSRSFMVYFAMPTSHLHQLNEIVEVLTLVKPRSLLDVGVGFGKYGFLAREYLELRDGREIYHDWQCRIDGIEAFAGYLTPLHDFVYDHVYVGEATAVVPTLDTHYDLLLLIDVLEHFEFQAGMAFLHDCQRQARNILVSTPRRFIAQKAAFGNPFETHRSHWRRQDFEELAPCFIPNEYSLIAFWGDDKAVVQKQFYNWKRQFKTWFPLSTFIYKRLNGE
jgi:hypothetical protein